MAIATQVSVRAEWTELYEDEYPGEENQFMCNYSANDFPLRFEKMDNEEGEYSKVWSNCLKALTMSGGVNGFYHGVLSFPDSLRYKGESYKIISLGDILDAAYGITEVHLPYELRIVDNKVFAEANANNPQLMRLSLPSAIAWIGKDAVIYNENFTDITCLAPIPPKCETSNGQILSLGTLEMDGETPFFHTDTHCTLSIPKGSLFFYKNHPGFNGFKSITELPIGDGWRKSDIQIEGATLEIAYIGNAEVVIIKVVPEEGVSAISLPSHVQVAGLKCTVIGIGPEALAGVDIKAIVLPEYLKFVSGNSFTECGISELILPAYCRYVGNSAFGGMKNLKKVRMMTAEEPLFAPDAFDGIPSDCELESVYSINVNAGPWSSFGKVVVLPPSGINEVEPDHVRRIIYSMQGQSLNNPKRGEIYIINGQKFISK